MEDNLGRSKLFFDYLTAIFESGLTPVQRLVAIAIAKHADGWRDSFAKVETLARETGLSKRTVVSATKVLVDEKWLLQTHSGRGGNSKLANCYDLNIPESESQTFGDSKCSCDTLQSATGAGQSATDDISKCSSCTTSTPYSASKSTPVDPPEQGHPEDPSGGTREGDSFWVGTSKKHPDGYFIRVEGSTRPKGNVVKVDLTRKAVIDLFGLPYSYEQRRDIMIELARERGLGSDSTPRPKHVRSAAEERRSAREREEERQYWAMSVEERQAWSRQKGY